MRVDGRELAAIFAGGCVGAIARALLTDALVRDPGQWPWATFVVNVAGAFALGWLMTRMALASYRRSFLGPGLCGALTTFSTMQLELLEMLDAADYALAGAYALASVVIGFGALALATRIACRPTRSGA